MYLPEQKGNEEEKRKIYLHVKKLKVVFSFSSLSFFEI
jgi:hypothetical protein